MVKIKDRIGYSKTKVLAYENIIHVKSCKIFINQSDEKKLETYKYLD